MFAFFRKPRKKSEEKRIFEEKKLLKMQHEVTEPEIELKLIDKHDGWSTIFQHICTEAQHRFELSFSDSRRIEYKTRNRYKDISPYDHSRVRLKRENIDYINASRVDVPKIHRSYILTQGPLPQTVSHFWVMILEKKCPAVVMLNRFIEKDQPKCHPYFPVEGQPDLVMNDVGLRVEFIEKQGMTEHFVTRLLLVHDVRTGKKHQVLHYHYLVWPDFGVPPSPDSFLDLLFAVRNKGVLGHADHPAVVHCSAGVGRSGVFCLVDACLKMAESKGSSEKVDLRATLLEMRRFRMGLIQTPEQLRFSYVALVEALKRMNLKPSSSQIPFDMENRFVSRNLATTPSPELYEEEEEEDEDEAAKEIQGNASTSNSLSGRQPERAGVPMRPPKERKGRKRCSLGRFAPHPGSVDDPESVWLLNNSTTAGEPLVAPGRRPSNSAGFSSVDGRHRTTAEDCDEEEEDGYLGDREGSGVDEGNADGGGEEVEECVEGCGCSGPEEERIVIRRRPLGERAKKSWEEIDRMLREQEKCGDLVTRRRKMWKLKALGWSVVVVVLGIALYKSA